MFQEIRVNSYLNMTQNNEITGNHLKISLIALRLKDVPYLNGGRVMFIQMCQCQ